MGDDGIGPDDRFERCDTVAGGGIDNLLQIVARRDAKQLAAIVNHRIETLASPMGVAVQ